MPRTRTHPLPRPDFMVLGFRVIAYRIWVSGLKGLGPSGCRIYGSGFMVRRWGFRAQGFGLRMRGLGFQASGEELMPMHVVGCKTCRLLGAPRKYKTFYKGV